MQRTDVHGACAYRSQTKPFSSSLSYQQPCGQRFMDKRYRSGLYWKILTRGRTDHFSDIFHLWPWNLTCDLGLAPWLSSTRGLAPSLAWVIAFYSQILILASCQIIKNFSISNLFIKTGFHAFIIRRNKAIIDSRLDSRCGIAPLTRVYCKEVFLDYTTLPSLPSLSFHFHPVPSVHFHSPA